MSRLSTFEIEAAYASERGQPPFDPAMMTTLLLYGYCNGVYSSRRIAKGARERVDFMSLVGLDPPDFRTVSDFRKRHLKALAGLFAQVLKLCEQAGLVKLGHVALDGTKIKANASKHKAMSYDRMEKRAGEFEAEVQRWLSAAEAADAEEDKAFGANKSGEEMPDWVADKKKRAERSRGEGRTGGRGESGCGGQGQSAGEGRGAPPQETRTTRRPAVRQARSQSDKNPRARPGGRIMKTKDGFIQGYNAQAAVDATAQVIVAHGLDAKQSDQHQLAPMADAIRMRPTRRRCEPQVSGSTRRRRRQNSASHIAACLARLGSTLTPTGFASRFPTSRRARLAAGSFGGSCASTITTTRAPGRTVRRQASALRWKTSAASRRTCRARRRWPSTREVIASLTLPDRPRRCSL